MELRSVLLCFESYDALMFSLYNSSKNQKAVALLGIYQSPEVGTGGYCSASGGHDWVEDLAAFSSFARLAISLDGGWRSYEKSWLWSHWGFCVCLYWISCEFISLLMLQLAHNKL